MKPSRPVLIAGNWKMHHGPQSTLQFLKTFQVALQSLPEMTQKTQGSSPQLKICLIPPTVSLPIALEYLQHLPIPLLLAAQNAHWAEQGAFTGEISGKLLKELGISWVLIAHSERRQYFGETHESAKMKIESLIRQGLQVIFCIGETQEQRKNNQTQTVLREQIQKSLQFDTAQESLETGRLILAYEPIWAIGTGVTATEDQIQEVHADLRNFLTQQFGTKAGFATLLIYGGSVSEKNSASILACQDVDGLLVGGASLEAPRFCSLIQNGLGLSSISSSKI